MLMLSFNITNVIHERIRIQAVADSQAMSTATLEARALNTMAFMNRSIAGAIVAEMAIHAWWTIAESEVGMLNAGYFAFLQVSATEGGQCSFWQPQHCVDAFQAMQIAFKFNSKKSSYRGKLNNLNNSFREAVEGLQGMITGIYADEQAVLDNTKSEISSRSNTMEQIRRTSAPYARYLNAIDGMNVSEFACALEGSKFDGDCRGTAWKPSTSVASASARAATMESAAMAARPKFEVGNEYWRSLAYNEFSNGAPPPGAPNVPVPLPINDPRVPKDIQRQGTFSVMSTTLPKTFAANNQVGAEISPRSPSIVSVTWRHGTGMWPATGQGAQPAGKKTSGNPYKGVPCNDGSNCFINFRLNTNSSADFGQPATYGAVTQDLRLQLNGRRGPWEVNANGAIQIRLQRNRPTRLVLVPQGNAYAVAKGKTYFHQLGQNGWQTPPNMFDPFWRAKLQSFGKQELQSILSTVGDTQGANIIAGGGAVEGKLQ